MTYDNKAYNEYLLGEDAVIDNQWPGYGIGDPFIMRYNGVYYLYVSSLDSEIGVRAYRSADLVNWEPVDGNCSKPGYVSEDSCTLAAYAPEVYYFNGTFYMYTSPGGGGHYILTSDSPEGPFVRATDNFGLSIDGSVLIDDDEQMYFTSANNGGIRMMRMENMLKVDTLDGGFVHPQARRDLLPDVHGQSRFFGRLPHRIRDRVRDPRRQLQERVHACAEQSDRAGNGERTQGHRPFFHRARAGYGFLLSRLPLPQQFGRAEPQPRHRQAHL